MKIENYLLPEIYKISKQVYDREIVQKKGIELLSNIINETSALFYIEAFLHLMRGTTIKRTINAFSADYFLQKIQEDYGLLQLENSTITLGYHIEYFENIEKVRMKKMRTVYDKYFEIFQERKLINNLDELLKNLNSFEFYISEGNESEKNSAASLLKDGICFLAYKCDNETRFSPSRFLGYINNTVESHLLDKTKNGRETNKAISKILRSKPTNNSEIDFEYLNYCKSLGIHPNTFAGKFNIKRKFWSYSLQKDFTINSDLLEEFPEGKIVERIHKARERNSEVVKKAKHKFKQKHGKLFCQVCRFDFQTKYGVLGEDFIEGHHTIAVSDMPPDYKTTTDEIAMLCSNCHKMIHKRRPWLSMDDLQKLILP